MTAAAEDYCKIVRVSKIGGFQLEVMKTNHQHYFKLWLGFKFEAVGELHLLFILWKRKQKWVWEFITRELQSKSVFG